MKRLSHLGFTLLELLIVVIIIGVLASLAIPQFAAAVDRSRETEALNIISAILTGEMVDYPQNNTFLASTPSAVTIPGVLHDWDSVSGASYAAGSAGLTVDSITATALADGVTVTLVGTKHGHGGAVASATGHQVRGIIVRTGAKQLQYARPGVTWVNI